MEVLEEVVQATKSAFDNPSERHVVLPAGAHSLERDGVDMVGDEAGVRTRSGSETLMGHAAQHCLQPFSIAVMVAPHSLKHHSNPHLSTGDGNSSIQEIQVWQLPIDAIVEDV